VARSTPQRRARLLRLASVTALAFAGVFLGAVRVGASSLDLSSSVSDLYPGVMNAMRITVENRSGHTVRLRWLQVSATEGTPGCPAENLVARTRRANLPIRARQAHSLTMMVGLRPSAPDACQGKRFPLRLAARASVVPLRSRAPDSEEREPTIAGGGAGPTKEAGPPNHLPGATERESNRSSPAEGRGPRSPALKVNASVRPAEPGITALGRDVLALAGIGLLIVWALRRRHPRQAG
jgi:hypothetical protein